ncbi:MvaI/BcnI family restriction endonuclease [Aliarcobacter butzleri]|uniref:MvaI/BcnI family restriction endonuclease n=1 Tax=Aliarcobacter butzleri TaxID=28197 RepID=UPI001EDB03A1|nr:MvaI/BcnI family restriction endonuclease [Aliarcobacter butzleri]MCG3691091.1 MvaI/BcnI family restriction endonuclease [Aliarcobacter butzleri]
MLHVPNDKELSLIQQILEYHKDDYAVFRITHTMFKKSIIDANISIYKLLKNKNIFDFDTAEDGTIYYSECSILQNDEKVQKKISFYRPLAKPNKPGDPRFWPYGLSSLAEVHNLIFATVLDGRITFIPLSDSIVFQQNLELLFGKLAITKSPQLQTVIEFLRTYKNEWLPSVSKDKKNDKDVGDTFENLLKIPANNSKKADMDGELELKTKRLNSKTKDTLFCKVQNRKLSPLKTVRDVILKYGYTSNDVKRPDYIDLFVTVSTKPNRQGLFHKVNREAEQLEQYHILNGKETLVAVWTFDILKKSLEEKHPSTAWICAEEKKIDDVISFRYCKLSVTYAPIFENFLLLLETNKVVFDWRGGQHPIKGQGSAVDYGHAFRVSEQDRNFLFGKSQEFEI